MGQLTNQFVSQSYQGLLNLANANTGFTANLQTITDGLGGSSPLQISQTQVNISGTFTVNGAPVSVDTGSLVTTSSFNAFTSSVDLRFDGIELETGSLQNQINQKLDTGSFNAYTSSNDSKVNSLIAGTGSYATTSSLTAVSQSIASTDLAQNNRLTAIESITGSLATTGSLNSYTLTSSFNAYTSSNDSKVNSLIAATASYVTEAESGSFMKTGSVAGNTLTFTKGDGSTFDLTVATGSQNRNGLITTGSAGTTQYITSSLNIGLAGSGVGSLDVQDAIVAGYEIDTPRLFVNSIRPNTGSDINVTGSLIIDGNISATSASFTYVNTVYETASVIYSSGSNQLGDASNDTQTLHGTVILPDGQLNIDGTPTASIVLGQGSGAVGLENDGNGFVVSTDQQRLRVNLSGVQVTGSLRQSGTFYPDVIDWYSSSIVQNTGSYVLTTDALGVTQYDSYQNVASALQPFISGSTVASSSFATNAATASIAYDVVVYGKCDNPGGLTRGTIVRIVGANGDNPLFNSASWTDDLNSANTLGMLSEDAAYNSFANVVVQGKVIGINTNGMTAGDLLFLSSSGQYTTSSVPAPYHEVRLGQVLRANLNNGSAYVTVDNGYELTELHDVDITSPINGDLLVYRSGSYGQWVNETGGELGFATTGSNRFNGNQIITGSVNVTGSVFVTGSVNLTPGAGSSTETGLQLGGNSSNKLWVSGSNNDVYLRSINDIILRGGSNANLKITGTGDATPISASIFGNASISGSLDVRNGNLDLFSNNTTVNTDLYLTSSQAGQSNIIQGWNDSPSPSGAGATQANYTGSLRITGSNNIVQMPQIRATGVGGGTDQQGYISGSGNMILSNFSGMYLNTCSLLFPKTVTNIIGNGSSITMNFTTSSLAGGFRW